MVADLNPSLRGWFGYFKQAYSKTFGMIDGFLPRGGCERSCASSRNGRAWGFVVPTINAGSMLISRECRVVRTTRKLANREAVSMKKPPTFDPYAGKPPVRFGGRGRRKPIPTPIAGRS